MLLEGIFLPVTTPFQTDGRLFLSKLETNVDRYGRTPAAGLCLLGDNSEAEMLTDGETDEVLKSAIAAAAPEQVMLATIARPGVHATLRLADVAAKAGYDAICLQLPLSANGQLRAYVSCVADRSPLPLVLVTTADQPRDVEMEPHANIIGIIASWRPEIFNEVLKLPSAAMREVTVTTVFRAVTGRMLARAAAETDIVSAESLRHGTGLTIGHAAAGQLKTRTKRVGLQLMARDTAAALECFEAGAVGAIPRLGACAPQACCELYQAFRDGDPALAAEKQDRVNAAAKSIAGPGQIKYGCDWNGYFGGRPRLPGLPLTGAERVEVETALAGMRN